MGKYLKMADVFVHDSVEELEQHIYSGYMSKHCSEYAAHAINSHDELVENMHNYKQEAEQLEARAIKEASRAQDLDVEVDRLTEFCESFSKFCEDVSEFMNHSNDGNSYWKSYQDYKKTKGL